MPESLTWLSRARLVDRAAAVEVAFAPDGGIVRIV